MDAIEVDGITKAFGGFTAVDDVSFSVREGEMFGILGPNGAGKSTLVGTLTTLLDPTSGTATVAGHDVGSEPAEVRSNLGVVFQEEAVDEELTGRENLKFHARMYGMSGSEMSERIEEVLSLIGLSDVDDVRVNGYSGGMKRRLELGRGLLHRPVVLFLDEPTVGLDARTRRDTWEYIRRMNREEGVTVVLTTHYIEEAEELCDRVGILDGGSVAAVDSPSNLKRSFGDDAVVCEVKEEVGAEGKTESEPESRRGPRQEQKKEHGQKQGQTPVKKTLREKPWVSTVTRTEGTIRLGVKDRDRSGGSRVPEVAKAVDAAGLTVVSVEAREPSLEEVFLEVTGSRIQEGKETEPDVVQDTEGTDDTEIGGEDGVSR